MVIHRAFLLAAGIGQQVSQKRLDRGKSLAPAAKRSPVYSHGCKSPAYWRNVPAAVWGYKLGGFQVLKKWLS